MKKILFIFIYILLPLLSFAQAKQGEKFDDIPVVQGRVRFLKEIPSKKDLSVEQNFEILKTWSSANYGKNPFLSSVRHDVKNNEFIVKAREELVLPLNSKSAKEKLVMRYRLNGFLFQDRCILEITEITFLFDNKEEAKLSKILRAVDFISDDAIKTKDNISEYRMQTRSAALDFFNKIAKDFEEQFGY